jgi:hypothetical protein
MRLDLLEDDPFVPRPRTAPSSKRKAVRSQSYIPIASTAQRQKVLDSISISRPLNPRAKTAAVLTLKQAAFQRTAPNSLAAAARSGASAGPTPVGPTHASKAPVITAEEKHAAMLEASFGLSLPAPSATDDAPAAPPTAPADDPDDLLGLMDALSIKEP